MSAESTGEYWAGIWSARGPAEVSWFEASPESSLRMIEEIGLRADAPILDLGGGASGLAGKLLRCGYTDVTVADISAEALDKARRSLDSAEQERIEWVVADVRGHDFGRQFALWHDRAVFHFMTEDGEREGYRRNLQRSLRPGGHMIVATFGPDGPTSCSGLPVVRYGAEELAAAFGPAARLVSSRLDDHETPSGKSQQFLYAHLEAS